MNRGLQAALLRSATKAASAGLDTATTLAFRWPILLAAGSEREWQAAWTEKIIATQAGLFDAALAWQKMLWGAGITPAGMMRVGEAMMAPAYARVRANARRLSR
ncbi:MAG: hypothetical protein J0H82_04730 [Alphaproteobacteria bacterium]|jgi:hypothetical protein|nr:hypothetical protein [Alphaproteobacteria bacterium]